jgi:hypothetical protein
MTECARRARVDFTLTRLRPACHALPHLAPPCPALPRRALPPMKQAARHFHSKEADNAG